MKRMILLTTLLICGFAMLAQEKPDIVTDRPDQTEASVLLPKGALQVETGFQFQNDVDNSIEAKEYTMNTTLIKYGINEYFELRLISEYIKTTEKQIGDFTLDSKSGFVPLAIGMKIKLAEEKGFWPQAALIGHVHTKKADPDYSAEFTSFAFRLTFAHTLSEKLALSYNLGSEWNGITPEATFLYTLSLAYKATSHMGVFIEGYSYFPEKSYADNRIDAGITYLISPVVQWDLSGGIGLSERAPDYFLSTGLSFRLFK